MVLFGGGGGGGILFAAGTFSFQQLGCKGDVKRKSSEAANRKDLRMYTFVKSTNGAQSRNIIYNMSSMVTVVVKKKNRSSTFNHISLNELTIERQKFTLKSLHDSTLFFWSS